MDGITIIGLVCGALSLGIFAFLWGYHRGRAEVRKDQEDREARCKEIERDSLLRAIAVKLGAV